MSVLIKGMEMPTSCWACPFSERIDPDTDRCFITGRSYDATFVRLEFRLDDCPLVPVPKHGRLIDADAYAFSGDLIDCPTIIPADKEGDYAP